jgi:hypothetical protein
MVVGFGKSHLLFNGICINYLNCKLPINKRWKIFHSSLFVSEELFLKALQSKNPKSTIPVKMEERMRENIHDALDTQFNVYVYENGYGKGKEDCIKKMIAYFDEITGGETADAIKKYCRDYVDSVFEECKEGKRQLPARKGDYKICMNCRNHCNMRCSQCKCVYFCNRECQKAAWKIHKDECKELAEESEVMEEMRGALASASDKFTEN